MDLQDEDGWTPLTIACRDGETEIARMLLAKGANIWLTYLNKGETALNIAVDLAYNPDIPFRNETVLLLKEAEAKSLHGRK